MTKPPSITDLDVSNGVVTKTPANMTKMRDILNQTGCGFCIAKWSQVTLHLGNGLTHSCHHPTPHKIPLEEIALNPSALHNTNYKKVQRRAMLNGERPAECDYCWRIEDNTTAFSDRVEKSLSNYSVKDHQDIVNMTGDENVYPKYLEVSFSRTCNFKCAYCGPDFSSKWAEEIASDGFYKMPVGHGYNWSDNAHYLGKEDNPYIDAFWKWWPDLNPHLEVLRITGGEPLLDKNTYKLLESLVENPRPELELSINSNGCPPDKLWDKFISLVQQLEANNSVKKFTLYTSAESFDSKNDYVRYGMNFAKWQANIEKFLDSTSYSRVTIMAAFNLLSITGFQKFLEYVLMLKCAYNYNGLFNWLEEQGVDVLNDIVRDRLPNEYKGRDLQTFQQRKSRSKERIFSRVGIDIPYVRQPDFLDSKITTINTMTKYFVPAINFMCSHAQTSDYYDCMGFEDWEIQKLKRIFTSNLFEIKKYETDNGMTTNVEIANMRARFASFIEEYDRRRNTNFLTVFPELSEFYDICKHVKNDLETRCQEN